MAVNTQIIFKKQRQKGKEEVSYLFMGADRLSNGVMVGGTDLLKCYDEVGKQIETLLVDNHQLEGSAECTIKRQEFATYMEPLDTAMLLWTIETWR